MRKFAIIITVLVLQGITYERLKAQQSLTNYSIVPKSPRAPKPELFSVSNIILPDSVAEAILVNYLPDGKHLIVEFRRTGVKRDDIAVMKEDGSDFKCLTCNLEKEIGGEMPVPLPDGKRIYTPTGILECSPSILDCKEAKILPLLYPEIPGAKMLMRIATNLSPDGVHVAGTWVTSKGTLVVVSQLTRVSDENGGHYTLANSKVVAGEHMVGDSEYRPFLHGAGEVKAFIGMGRYLTCSSSFEGGNFDLSKIDLQTGKVTRLTRHFSYEEGTYPSPDGKWIIFQTQRQIRRLDAFGLIPRPLFAGLPQAGGVAMQRNAEYEGYATKPKRFYGLSMVDQYGDRARFPEDGYTGQDITVAKDNFIQYTAFGNFAWDPTSTRGIFWEQLDPKDQKPGGREGRLRLIRFTSRKPTKPIEPMTPAMTWATDLKDIKWPSKANPEPGTFKGYVSGYAQVIIEKAEPTSKTDSKRVIKYFDFSDDKETILNGVESMTLNQVPSWDADITVTGKKKGFLKAKHVVLPWDKMPSGTIDAQLGVHKVSVDLSKGLPTGVPGVVR